MCLPPPETPPLLPHFLSSDTYRSAKVDFSNMGYDGHCGGAVCRCLQPNPADPARASRIYCLGGGGQCDAPGDYLGTI
jgi:hypothetical protein